MEAHAKDVPENRTLPRIGVSGETIAIPAVGVMLGGMVFTTGSWIRGDMHVLRDDIRILRDEVRSVRSGLSELRERVIRIESLLQKDSTGLQG